MSIYTVKGLKSWRARDGIGTQCSLCRDGIKVAEYTDEGNGGSPLFRWEDRSVPVVMVPSVNWEGQPWDRKCSPEEALLLAHIKGMTYTSPIDNQPRPMTEDIYLAELCDAYESVKKMKAKLKKCTLFRLKSETYREGEFRVLVVPYSAAAKALLVKRYGEDLMVVLNETMGEAV